MAGFELGRPPTSAEALAALYGLDIEEVVRSIRLDAHAA